jgi:hypothetical protein
VKTRVYLLLDVIGSNAKHVAQVLCDSPGVISVDALKGPPDVAVALEARNRE